jgi:hypothetical protein
MSSGLTFFEFVRPLRWIDGRPLPDVIEPYRRRIFDRAFAPDPSRPSGFVYNLILTGRGKKNWKTADLIFACLYALMADSPGGNQCYLVANDSGQAADDLELAKKLIRVNPILESWVTVRKNRVERRDGEGFAEVLPGQDVVGSHGKTFRFLGVDEIHGQRTWDLLEALAPDPSRPDCQTWITSYASLFHRPGVPLFDLCATGRAGTDPTMYFDWHAADYCTDPGVAHLSPEQRANPSMASWDNPHYLAQQQRRLPAHKYRRLHLNLPGVPEGSAFAPEPVMDAVDRGVTLRAPERGESHVAFVDMSGGSSDDAVLAVGHRDAGDRFVLDRLLDQGARPPFDPRLAVERFVQVLREYGVTAVSGDKFAGETFVADFARHGVTYHVSALSKSQIYEAFEPLLNGQRVGLLDHPTLEQQLMGLVWRGGKIDHSSGEHDDYANAACGVIVELAAGAHCRACDDPECTGRIESMPLCVVGGSFYYDWLALHGLTGDEEADVDAEPLEDQPAPLQGYQADGRPKLSPLAGLTGFAQSIRSTAAATMAATITGPAQRVGRAIGAVRTEAKEIREELGAAAHTFVTTFKTTGSDPDAETLEAYERLRERKQRRRSAEEIERKCKQNGGAWFPQDG